MQLYNTPMSPFGTRVKIAIRAKSIEVEEIAPLGGHPTTPEFRKINPVGKIPVLITNGGLTIPESEAILNYLEDRFPTPSLRPAGAEERARVNTAIRIMDTYVMAPVGRTFAHLNPASRDAAVVAAEVARFQDGLALLEHYVATPLPTADAGLTLADCVLAPSIHLTKLIALMLGVQGDVLRSHPALAAYYEAVQQHPVIGAELAALTAAQSAGH
jgi:glutathione S-transferase